MKFVKGVDVKRKKILWLLILVPALMGVGRSIWKPFINKTCGYKLMVPRKAKLEKSDPCKLVIVWPDTDLMMNMTLTLETSGLKDVDDSPKAENGAVTAGSVDAGGLRFDKTELGDGGAGHIYLTETYFSMGKSHEYLFTGQVTTTNPGMRDGQASKADPLQTAKDIFDSVVIHFKPLE